MVHEAAAHDRHRLEAAVRVRGKARHAAAVVHAPAVLAAEIVAKLPPSERRRRPEGAVARRVGVVVVRAEQERIDGGPQRAQRLGLQDGGHGRLRKESETRMIADHFGLWRLVAKPRRCAYGSMARAQRPGR